MVAVREQLGREPTTSFSVVARCSQGHPLVIRNHPLDADGNPFPTLYWLTCADAVRAVSRLEADGWVHLENAKAFGLEPQGLTVEQVVVKGVPEGLPLLATNQLQALGGAPSS